MRLCFSRQKSSIFSWPATSMKQLSSRRMEPSTRRSASILEGSPLSRAAEGDVICKLCYGTANFGRRLRKTLKISVDGKTLAGQGAAGDLHRYPQILRKQ